ncbi:MAG: YdeI/OmpD-associated family protein [Cytophagales bacterium]|nr:YdeI/OmpD-associated family protein [Cytophagales bacterium]
MQRNKTVEEFIDKHLTWKKPLLKFRKLLLKTELEETIKWGIPVYTINGKNVVGMGAFKAYVGIWFFQGSFLSDPEKILINAQDGKTKGMRQMRFTSEEGIDYNMIGKYVAEAIQNQKEGKEVRIETKKTLILPKELEAELSKDREVQQAFDALSLSKRREYAEHIELAKRPETKQNRLEKILPMIRAGVGLSDKYRT